MKTTLFTALAIAGCAIEPTSVAPAPGVARALHIRPIDDARCQQLAEMPELPAGVTIGDMFDCIGEDDRALVAEAFARKHDHAVDLDAFIAQYRDVPVRVAMRDGLLARPGHGRQASPSEMLQQSPVVYSAGGYGVTNATCSGSSCLSHQVRVARNTTRTIAHSSAIADLQSLGEIPDWREVRIVDDARYGAIPDFDQDNLANEDRRDTACGPVAGINLLEWWNIPIYSGDVELTRDQFDARTEKVVECMDTEDGIDFTDDENLVECLDRLRTAGGRVADYPGWVWRKDDPDEFTNMIGLVSRGYPVIALYASGSETLHWALLAGFYRDAAHPAGMVKIANGTDLSIDELRDRWGWNNMGGWEQWWALAFVDKFQYFAYYRAPLEPARTAQQVGDSLPAYGANGFRYCGTDDTCQFDGAEPTFALVRAGNTIRRTDALAAFVRDNPQVRGEWWARMRATGRVVRLSTFQLSTTAGDLPMPGNRADYAWVQFFVHSPDFRSLRWIP